MDKKPALVGILPLGRPTFDVPYASERLARMIDVLDQTGRRWTGRRELLFDAEQTRTALAELEQSGVGHLLILQVTFTDAQSTLDVAQRLPVPMSIWAVPEPRLGGRLRLNAFCGLNLASHALGMRQRPFGWLYLDPDDNNSAAQLDHLLDDSAHFDPIDAVPVSSVLSPALLKQGSEIRERLRSFRIARIGRHPDGFTTCDYDRDTVREQTGAQIDELELDTLFERARSADTQAVAVARTLASSDLQDLETVDTAQLDRSLRLKVALDQLSKDGAYDAFALRCWPETFTEYGGAICGPASMLGERRIPCACEADVYGAITQLMLQSVADAPVFLVDIVDIDVADNSIVVWHCGQAPVSMADPDRPPVATIHTNRKMPLLYQFALKPGRVTFARLSQSRGSLKLVIHAGEVLKRPMAFTGTSAVLRCDRSAEELLDRVIRSGLEHHVALAYGEHRALLRAVAVQLNIPVLEL